MPRTTRIASIVAASFLLLAVSTLKIPPAVKAAVDAPDRSADDIALDAGRHPAETLAFFGIRPGARVAELGAGGGYTTELLARVVGSEGRVYGQNSPFILERFAEKPWSLRLGKPVMVNVVRLDRAFDDPFPPDVRDLDAVLIVLLYHDTVWMKVDRAKMNRAVFAALAPGGVYGIVDHSAVKGHGVADVETLHRIDEQTVRDEVEAAGFTLAAEGDFLRNPSDPRDWNASPRVAAEKRGTSDRFVLKYVKPTGRPDAG
jgi:predicted methyltransferase